MEYVILRPTCVFGPYIKAFTIGPVELMRKGVPVIVGDGNGYLDAVYVEDVVGAMLLAAQSPRAHGEIFNIGNVNVTFKEFYSYYRHILRRPARHLPLALVHSILKMFEISPQFIKKKFPELKKGLVFLINMYSNTKLYPSTKAREILGYNPRFSLAMGMLKTELWVQQHYSLTTNRYSQRNYGPTYTFHPNMVIHPTTEEEIVQTIQTALHSKMRVRAIGSLHSFSRIPETDGICIILDNYNRLLKVNGNSVTVQAGMRIRDLHQHLAEHHLALPVNGSITEQTVSGAVSTATHGGSIHHGTISDYVESVRIVKADGHILEVATPHELLHAISVSMGTLGIISTITFNCIPSFNLKSDKLLCKTQEVIDNFESIQNNNDYVDMMYFPITDDIAILRTNRFDNELDHNNYDQNRITESDYAPKTKFSRWLTTIRLKLSLQILHKLNRNALQRRITQPLAHSYYKPRMGRSDFVLSFTDLDDIDPYPIQDMEIAIPYQQAGTAIHALRDHFATTQSYPLLPIHIRCSAQSHLWLSPSYKQDVCWIEFWQYPPSDHFFKQIHDVLAPFQYRFHWGKQSQASQEYIKAQYERWEDFVRLRDAWDPQGVFLNPRLDSWFCKKK
jgi:L-gulonolactone oxidase